MIKRRVCDDCRIGFVFSKGLCKFCWNKKYGKPIKKISKNMSALLKEYSPERKTFLEKFPYCQLKLEGCTSNATCIHHKKGKHSKDLYLNQEFWMASCISCNGLVERIGGKAYELGLKIRHNTK